MKDVLQHWKEGLGLLAYFGFLAIFTPRAEALGWGYKGVLFCVLAGALLVCLVYLLVVCVAEYLAEHREEMSSFREYMGIGTMRSEQLSLASLGRVSEHTAEEVDAMLATNPYASPELFDDDTCTHLLTSISADTHIVDEADLDRTINEEMSASGGRVTASIGDNPRRRLLLADNFQPDANDLLATGVFFVGIPGSGKTAALALFLEQYIQRFHLPAVIFDLVGDFKSLVEDGLCPRGLIATPAAMPALPNVIKYRLQVVIDLQQWRRPGEAFINHELAAKLIAHTLRDLMNAQSAIDPGARLPCLVGLDETHIWTPQTPPSYLLPETAKELLDTLVVVATTGRKYGVVPFLATQRIAKVHKDVIGGCETRVFGKTDLDNDLKRYREYISPQVISDQGIRSLGKGRMVVCIDGKRLVVQFYQRASRHSSHTPGVTQTLDQFVEALPPEVLTSITRPVEVAPATPVSAQRQTEAQPEPTVTIRGPSRSGSHKDVTTSAPAPALPQPTNHVARQRLSPMLLKTLALYQEGTTSCRRIAEKLSDDLGYEVSKDAAWKYLKQLKRMGEISE